MSRDVEIIVLASEAEAVMEPLTRSDPNRAWGERFSRIDNSFFSGSRAGSDRCYAWTIQFNRPRWRELLSHLESLPWPDPYSVQVLIHDQDDSCFSLWMLYEGQLSEVPLPHTTRKPFSDLPIGVLHRTDDPKR